MQGSGFWGWAWPCLMLLLSATVYGGFRRASQRYDARVKMRREMSAHARGAEGLRGRPIPGL